MFQRDQFRLSRLPSALRTRTGLVAAGLGVSMACGAGAAVAATGGDGADAAVSRTATAATASVAAGAVAKQADAQAAAAAHAKQVQAERAEAAAKKAESEAEKKAAKVKADRARAKAKADRIKKAHGWTDPVDHYKLSAKFGRGGTMWSHKHSGQDFAVPTGTTVKAAHSGTVVKAGPNGAGDGSAYGNAIVIRHGDGTYSQYAHLSKIKVWAGQHVKADQRIAYSGNTGNSSGPHLHFEIRTTPNYGSAVNPLTFLRHAGVTV
ncbi:M23 family metallopeptidase [Streptomyces sp. SID3212]|uniref:M23 family metallopeptidase n=1 Tax=Streptomyces sp. SID3212 TaxID=2690259 RepID=UPI0013720CFF|nr:M23 family metallopeptidase [Streptomyces sp. SID3212]MYV52924.1 peptidoglycan DD-metalloendopeptidase family protein [Streptomyces sp. SID3212]